MTGYNIEVAIPAYKEPEAGATLGDTPGSAGWGTKVGFGEFMYMSIQLDKVDCVLPQKAYDSTLEYKTHPTDYMSQDELNSFNAMAFGLQYYKTTMLDIAKVIAIG